MFWENTNGMGVGVVNVKTSGLTRATTDPSPNTAPTVAVSVTCVADAAAVGVPMSVTWYPAPTGARVVVTPTGRFENARLLDVSHPVVWYAGDVIEYVIGYTYE